MSLFDLPMMQVIRPIYTWVCLIWRWCPNIELLVLNRCVHVHIYKYEWNKLQLVIKLQSYVCLQLSCLSRCVSTWQKLKVDIYYYTKVPRHLHILGLCLCMQVQAHKLSKLLHYVYVCYLWGEDLDSHTLSTPLPQPHFSIASLSCYTHTHNQQLNTAPGKFELMS